MCKGVTPMRLLLSLVLLTAGLGRFRMARADASGVPHLLIYFGGTNHQGVGHNAAVVEHLAKLTGAFTIESSNDPAVFTSDLYESVDGVIFLGSVAGMPWTDAQKQDFLHFFSCGGAFIGVHAVVANPTSTVPTALGTLGPHGAPTWPGYADLVGATFDAHPHLGSAGSYPAVVDNALPGHPLQSSGVLASVDADVVPHPITDVTINVEDHTNPATAAWASQSSFRITEEIYRYTQDPRDVPGLTVLLSLDENSDYEPQPAESAGVANPRDTAGTLYPWLGYGHANPVSWVKTYGQGRVFYTDLGHSPATFDRIDFQDHLLGGIQWATQVGPDPTCL